MFEQTIHKIQTGIDLAIQAINSIPAHSWYVLGSFVAAGIATSVAVEAVLLYKQYKSAEKVAKRLTGYIVIVATGLSAAADYFLTNSQLFLPFLGAAYPTIYMVATKWHIFTGNRLTRRIATAIAAWLNNKKQVKKSIFTTDLGESDTEAPKASSLFS